VAETGRAERSGWAERKEEALDRCAAKCWQSRVSGNYLGEYLEKVSGWGAGYKAGGTACKGLLGTLALD